MSERELVKAAQAGDFDAFNRLISGYREKIYRLALKLTGNRHDAEDVMQETFLKAVDNLDKFRSEASFGTWLYTIAMNVFRAETVSAKKMELKPIEDYLPEGHSHGDIERLYEWGDPHDHYEQKEIRNLIQTALAEMPYKYSMPFVLRYMEELPVNEVARIMNLSVAAAKSRILRARLALREYLSEQFKERTGETM